MKNYNLNVKNRSEELKGKNHAGRLRRSGMLPGNIIAGGKSALVQFAEKDIEMLIKSGLRNSSVLSMEGESSAAGKQVVVKEIQRHPVTNRIQHIDFYQLTKGKRLLVTVGVVPNGLAKGVKSGGILEQFIHKLRVKTVPEALKEVVDVDVTNLELGQAIRLGDLNLPSEWDVVIQGNPIILKVAYARVAPVEAATPGAATPATPSTPAPAS